MSAQSYAERREKALAVAALIPERLGVAYVCSETHGCEVCGCLIKLEVSRGLRCARCWPPLQLSRTVRRLLSAL
jgi:hypothetical protein